QGFSCGTKAKLAIGVTAGSLNTEKHQCKMGHIISVFVRELPALYLFGGIFLPVTLLLIGLIYYLKIKLAEVMCVLTQNSQDGRVWVEI
uniref:Uncharacterized protein n=1 Tax=Xenopus tropicalis TaxID=8364 RepID=A0A6I8S7N1_XENTR